MSDSEWGRTLSLAAHELRTPISVVVGYMRMLLNEQLGPVTERQRQVLGEAIKSGGRLTQLAGELSDLGHLEAGTLELRREAVELFPLLAEAVALVSPVPELDVELRLLGQSGGARLAGDQSRLRGAFTALATASLREAPPARIVEVHRSIRQVGSARLASVVMAPSETAHVLGQTDAASLVPFDGWRGGLGLSLVLAARVIGMTGGQILALPGGRQKGTLVLLPIEAA